MANPNLPWTPSFEPKREHKFVLELQNINVYFINDVTIPKPTVTDSAKHNFLSHTFKFPGKLTWDDSTFTLVDPVDLNAADLLIKHLKSSGYVFPSSFDIKDPTSTTYYLKTIKKGFVGPNNQIQGMRIKSLDADGSEIEAWTLKNSFIKTVDFGNFKYDTDGLKNIKVTVSCDWVDYQSFRSLDGTLMNTATVGS
jgi:hypothetical protein